MSRAASSNMFEFECSNFTSNFQCSGSNFFLPKVQAFKLKKKNAILVILVSTAEIKVKINTFDIVAYVAYNIN